MVKSDSLKATRITIRRACEDDLAQIRNLVLDGLYEIYPLAWRRTFLPSLICQVTNALQSLFSEMLEFHPPLVRSICETFTKWP